MRTYEVRTYGCQMNVHDSERLSGLLEGAGYVRPGEGEQADVVVFNTCAVRENAEERVYGRTSQLLRHRKERPGLVFGITGCMAEHLRDKVSGLRECSRTMGFKPHAAYRDIQQFSDFRFIIHD